MVSYRQIKYVFCLIHLPLLTVLTSIAQHEIERQNVHETFMQIRAIYGPNFSSDLRNSRAILWREYERDGGTWMREGIRGEQGERNVWHTYINAHTIAGYLHSVIGCVQFALTYFFYFILHCNLLIKGLRFLTLLQQLFSVIVLMLFLTNLSIFIYILRAIRA